MFWKDVLELVRDEDLPRAERLISEAVKNPGLVVAYFDAVSANRSPANRSSAKGRAPA